MPPSRPRLPRLLLAATVLAGAVAPAAHAAGDPGDPWEPMNRRFFAINEGLDKHIIGPIAHGFGSTPGPLRAGLRNFSRNLSEPVVFVNDVLQFRGGQAARTLARFVVNSTIGIGGLFDVAGHNHVPHHDNGFGTTLGRWGFAPGPYLFLPLLGPSDVRDALGGAADAGLNPLTYSRYPHKAAISIGTTIVGGLGRRLDAEQDLKTIRETSTDPYASLRSFYLQNRQSEVSGKDITIENLPSFDEPGPTPAPGTEPRAEPTPAQPEPTPTPPAETPKPQAAAVASPCAPPAVRWAQADVPYATWRGG
jgi:phospholipid-binding lipoprotein MlaA